MKLLIATAALVFASYAHAATVNDQPATDAAAVCQAELQSGRDVQSADCQTYCAENPEDAQACMPASEVDMNAFMTRARCVFQRDRWGHRRLVCVDHDRRRDPWDRRDDRRHRRGRR